MQIIQKKISEIKPYEKNARVHSDAQIQSIFQSIKSLGFNDPIEIDDEGTILSGHARFEAGKLLGLESIPCVVHSHLTSAQKQAYIIAANKIQMNSTWDNEALKSEIISLMDCDFDVTISGFNIEEIDYLLNEVKHSEENSFCDEDECPDFNETVKTKRGDIWILGGHRLMCGDSIQLRDVELLTEGKKIDLVFTDPPYNMSFNGRSGKHDVIKNDNLSEKEFNDFIKEFCSILKIVSPNNYYVWCNWKIYSILKENLEFNNCIVWVKNNFGLGSGYRPQHEFCIFSGKIDDGITNESDVWDIDKETDYVHPTQKPVLLSLRAFNNHKKAMNVLDLFGGSGSTLIGCQKLGRRCFMMELDEKYCDIIIKRWQNFTGKKAVLESTGDEFDKI